MCFTAWWADEDAWHAAEHAAAERHCEGMYAATIESELDTQSAMDFIRARTVRSSGTSWPAGLVKLPVLRRSTGPSGRRKSAAPDAGDSLNLQTAQDTDNGYSVFERHCCGISLPGWVSRMSSFPGLRPDELLHGTGQCERVVGVLMGRRKFVASRQASQMFLCWRKRPSFAAWWRYLQKRASVFGSPQCLGELRLDRLRSYGHRGLKEVQEAVMLIEAGLPQRNIRDERESVGNQRRILKNGCASSASSAASSASSASASKDERPDRRQQRRAAPRQHPRRRRGSWQCDGGSTEQKYGGIRGTRAETAAKRAEDIASAVALEMQVRRKRG